MTVRQLERERVWTPVAYDRADGDVRAYWWLSSDMNTRWTQRLRINDGTCVLIGKPTSEPTSMEANTTIDTKPVKRRRCTKCEERAKALRVEPVRWLGIRWAGVPKPLRLRVRRGAWPFYFASFPGCGCIIKLKSIWMAVRYA